MKLLKFCTVALLCMLSLLEVQAQNGSLCVEALIEIREGNTTVTCEPGAMTWIRFKTSKVNTPYAYAVTDQEGTILRLSTSDKVSFLGLPGGQLRVYAFSHIGLLVGEEGDNIFTDDLASICSVVSPNYIEVLNIVPEGGTVQSGNGRTTEFICTSDNLSDILTFETSESEEPIYAYIVTDENNMVLSTSTQSTIDFSNAPAGTCRVWGIAYTGDLAAAAGMDILNDNLAEGCFDVSDNYVSVVRTEPDGATISANGSADDIAACDYPGGSGLSITFANTNEQTFFYSYIITDVAETTFTVVSGNSVNLSDLPMGSSRVRGISYAGQIAEGSGAFADLTSDLTGCYDLSENFITLTRIYVEGGQVALADGSTEIRPCGIDELSDQFSFQTTSTAKESYAWVLTGQNNVIKGIYTENQLVIDAFTDEDDFRVYGLSYSGAILSVIGQAVNGTTLVDGCFELSENFVTITRIRPDGGNVSLADGSTDLSGCDTQDNFGQVSIDLANSGKSGFAYTYFLTDNNNKILRIFAENAILLSDLPEGSSRIWGLSYEGSLIAEIGDNPVSTAPVDGCFDLSDNFVSLERIIVDGGSIALAGGGTEIETCGTDNVPDQFDFQATTTSQESYAWVLTDKQGIIKKIFTENPVSIDEYTDVDTFVVKGLSYRGTLLPVIGQNLNSLAPVDGCFDLSENTVQITRITPDGGAVALTDGSTEFSGCDSPEVFGQISIDLANSGKPGYTYVYFLTNINNRILQIITGASIPLTELPKGSSRIYGLSYQGTLTAKVGDNAVTSIPVDGCFDLSDNFISLQRTVVDGGAISILNGGDSALTCGSDKIADAFTFNSTTTAKDQPYVLVITDVNNRVFSTANGGIIDFDLFAAGTYRIWGLSYTGTLTVPFGSILSNISPSTGCYDLSNNFVTIRQEETNGGQLQFSGGGVQAFTCPADGNPDVLQFVNNGFTSDKYVYLISDQNNVIIATTVTPGYDFDQSPVGICRIWGLAYSGQLNAPIGQKADTLVFSDECYSLTSNFLTVIKEVPNAGSISLKNGGDLVFTCPGDGQSDMLDFTTTSTYSGVYLYLITHEDNRVIDVSFNGTYDFDFAEPGNCRIWGVAFTGNWIIQEGSLITEEMLSDDCWAITDNYVTVIREVPTAGNVSFADGSSTRYTCPGDGNADLLSFANTSAYPGSYLYLITDENNKILDSTTDESFDFDDADLGTCRVWGVAYTGNLTFLPGDDAAFVNISDDCFDISDNFLSVIRDNPEGGIISTPGGTTLTLCVGDALADVVQLSVAGASNSQYAYLITDEAGFLLASITDNSFDFNNAVGGICRIYGLAYTGEITALPGDDIQATILTNDCYDLSDNFITLNRLSVDGSTIFTGSGSTAIEYICSSDGNPDVITFQNGNSDPQANYQYLITNTSNNILGDLNGNTLDFEGSPFDSLRIWGVSYLGNPTLPIGTDITNTVLSDSCYDVSNNFITLIHDLPMGGNIAALGGSTDIRLCIGGDSGLAEMTTTSTSIVGYTYLVTTPEQVIVAASSGSTIDFNPLEAGNYLIYGLSYTGQLTYNIGDTLTNTELANSCFELSSNTVQAERSLPLDGGTITSAFGDPLYVCLNDGIPDIGAFETTSSDPNYRYVITDTLDRILIPGIVGNVVDFDKAAPNFCRVYGVSYTGNFTAVFGTSIFSPLSDLCSAVSGNYITLIKANHNGGTVSTAQGDTEIDLVVGDGIADVVNFDSTGTSGVHFSYVVTDETNAILSIVSADSLDFEGAETGICRVWGVSYSGELLAQTGDTITAAVLSSGCYDLSENFITVNRNNDGEPLVEQQENSSKYASTGIKMHVYPNPVSAYLQLQLRVLENRFEDATEVVIEVFDVSGRRWSTQVQELHNQENNYRLDVRSLPIGMYILRISDGNSWMQERFFKQ